MFENLIGFFKKMGKKEGQIESKNNKDEAKERLHLVLMQDRANVSADFLDMMRQEIIDVIKKYIDVEDGDIDVRLTNKQNGDGTTGAPALYANIPIKSIKNETRKMSADINKEKENKQNKEEKEEIKEVEEKTTEEETQEDNKKVENIEQDKEVKEEGEKNNQEESNKSNNEIKNENNTPKANNKNKIAPKANVSKEKNNKKKK